MALPGVGRALRRGTSGLGGSIGIAAAVGVGVAMNRANLSTYALDTVDEALTGQTTTDVTFTGGERGLVGAAAFNMLPHGLTSLRPPPFRYLRGNAALGSYASNVGDGAEIDRDDYAFYKNQYSPNMSNQGNYRRGVDGSMVFGMYNVR